MRIWKRSLLSAGQRVIIPPTLLVTSETKNLKYAEYVGETEYGLSIRLHFNEGVLSDEPNAWHYTIFVSWNSIHCGDVHIRYPSGEEIRAIKEVL